MLRAAAAMSGLALLLPFAASGQSQAKKDTKPAFKAGNRDALNEARKILGDGFPQVAAVKAERLLETAKLSAKERQEAAGIAAEGWVRARDAERTGSLLDRHEAEDERFWRAQAHILKGDLAAAEKELRAHASGEQPGDHKENARLSLAYVLMAQGREPAARDALKVLRDSSDENVARHARLMFNELEIDVDRGQRVIDRLARESGGKSGEVQFLRAKGWLQLGDAPKAETLLVDLSAMKGLGQRLHDASRILLAEALLRQGKAAEAEQAAVQFIDAAADTEYWDEAFDVLDRAHRAGGQAAALPMTAARWIGDPAAPERQAHALFVMAGWLRNKGRQAEAAGLLEALLQLHPGHSRESDAMRLAMEAHGAMRSDARVLELAKTWKEKHGGGGESVVDFLTGDILHTRGDYKESMAAFRRSADVAGTLAERSRALYNAAVAAVKAGEIAAYAAILAQLQSAGAGDDPARPESGGDAAGDLEIDRALQLAMKSPAEAEGLLQKLAAEHPEHPRIAEAHIALADIALLDVPPRPRDAEAAAQAALRSGKAGDKIRERAAYVAMWAREAAGSLKDAAAAGLEFLKQWPASPLASQVRMKTGECYFRLEDYANARTQFELLSEEAADPQASDAALFFAAKAALSTLTPEGANRAMEIWAELSERGGPLAAAARMQTAEELRKNGQQAEALKIFDSLLAEKTADAAMKQELRFRKAETLIGLAQKDAKQAEAAAAAASALWRDEQEFVWKGRAGALLAQALEAGGKKAEALAACHDVVNAGLENTFGPANAAEFHWFYWAGFRAVALLEAGKQWEAAAKMAEKLAQTAGDRAADAKKRATEIRLEHFLWDDSKK